MLEFFRRGIKSWVAKILLGLLIVSFAVWGIGDIFTSGGASTVATVGQTTVDTDRFARALVRQQRMLVQQTRQAITFAELRAGGVDQQILSGLVRDATFSEELSVLGVAVPAPAIANAIAVNPAFRDSQGNFNQFAYESAIAQQGFNPIEYEALMAQLLGQQILSDAVGEGVGTLPGVAEAIARYDGERRRVASIRLPVADAADPDAPTDDDLAAHLKDNAEDFRLPERRSGRFLLISPLELTMALAPSDEEIETEYTANPDAFTVEPRRTVEQIVFSDAAAAEDAVARLEAGETSFGELAAEQNLSLDDISLGEVAQGELGEAADAAIFAATEPGIVGPVDGPFGQILLNVTAVTVGGLLPLEEVTEDIRLVLARNRARQAANEKLEQIDDMRASGEPLDAISTETGVPLITFTGMAPDGSVTEGETPFQAADPQFWAEITDAQLGEERDVAPLSDGSYIVAMIDRIDDSRIPELEEARDVVAASWDDAQRLAAQLARAEELVGGAGGGTDLASISVTVLQGISERAPFIRAQAPEDFSPELIEAIFAADEGATVSGPNASGDAVLIVQVRGVIDIDDETLEAQVAEFGDALAGAIARDQLEYYARALEQRHGSGVNPAAVEGVFERLSQTGY